MRARGVGLFTSVGVSIELPDNGRLASETESTNLEARRILEWCDFLGACRATLGEP